MITSYDNENNEKTAYDNC